MVGVGILSLVSFVINHLNFLLNCILDWIDISNENTAIIIKDEIFISLGNLSRKYTSDGKISKLKTFDRNTLIFSIFKAKNTPRKIPVKVAKNPIENPVRKNAFLIELSLNN